MRSPRLPPLAAAAAVAFLSTGAVPAAPRAPLPPPVAPSVAAEEDPVLAAAAEAWFDEDGEGAGAARDRWEALPRGERIRLLRAGLGSRRPTVSLFSALELRPHGLSLEEIHLQSGLLVGGAGRVFVFAGGREDRVPGLDSLGSARVMDLYEAAVRHDPSGEDAVPVEDLHRVTLPAHLPRLASLLERADGALLAKLLWNFNLLADNSDRHRALVARTLLLLRAWIHARLEGRPAASLPDPTPAGDGSAIPGEFRALARLAWGIGEDPARVHLPVPGVWLDRWAEELVPEPGDIPFLEEVARCVPDDGLHGSRRAWAARELARIGTPGALSVLEALRADGFAVDGALRAEPEGELAPLPRALGRAEARELLEEWTRDPPFEDGDRLERAWERLPLVEVVDPEGLDRLLRRWTEQAEGEDRERVLAARMRRGDAGAVPALLEAWPLGDPPLLGRVRDPRVRAFLVGKSGEGRGATAALRALAIFDGLPEPLVELVRPAPDGGWGREPFAEARRHILAGRPGEAVLHLAREEPLRAGWTIGRIGLLRTADAAAVLRGIREDRSLGLYWNATAGLALAGDAGARAEFLAFLAEDLVPLYDEAWDPVAFTLDGDPGVMDHWFSRVGANCCLWNYAALAIRGFCPLLHEGNRVGDSDRLGPRMHSWWRGHRGRLARSLLVDGWVPAPR